MIGPLIIGGLQLLDFVLLMIDLCVFDFEIAEKFFFLGDEELALFDFLVEEGAQLKFDVVILGGF